MKLNLTQAQKANVSVTFNVNKFEAYLPSGALLGKYASKSALRKEILDNQIHAVFDRMAQNKYLENYGG